MRHTNTEMRPTHGMPSGVYVTIVEHKDEGPLVMEAALEHTSFDAAGERAEAARENPFIIRTCVARVSFADGNFLLFKALSHETGAPAKAETPDFERGSAHVLLTETKNEGPLIWETQAHKANLEACSIARDLRRGDNRTIRTAIGILSFAFGNKQLLTDLERTST